MSATIEALRNHQSSCFNQSDSFWTWGAINSGLARPKALRAPSTTHHDSSGSLIISAMIANISSVILSVGMPFPLNMPVRQVTPE